ncbi:MAG: hypothetical protein AB1894_27280 [Chloroflexota bacterium]
MGYWIPRSLLIFYNQQKNNNHMFERSFAMKLFKSLAVLIVLALVAAPFVPAYAQLGATDTSEFKVQNVSGGTVQVTIDFINESGVTTRPAFLDSANTIANPFTLTDGQSILIDVSDVPGLASGRYSVLISSTGKVVAMASVTGEGANRFAGGYDSFSSGASTMYLATMAYNYYGWYSMITVMNIGSAATDVTVTFTCTNPGAVGLTGTLTRSGLPKNTAQTWDLETTTPTGFTTGVTQCQGSAIITATGGQAIVAVNNQNIPTTGATNSFEAVMSGYGKVYVPQLSTNYYGWVSSLNVLKRGSGTTTVTVDYGDAEPNDTFVLSDATPSQQLYMPTWHPTSGRYSATVTSSPAMDLLISIGNGAGGMSGGYNGFGAGAASVAMPLVMKYYFNWYTAINCMNVSSTPTTLNVKYEGYTAYNHPTTLNEGGSVQIVTINEAFLPTGYAGSVVVTANAPGALIACMTGSGNYVDSLVIPGDWTIQYNALPK